MQQGRRRQRERKKKKDNRFIEKNKKFPRSSCFFVHFFAITARLRRENTYFHVLWSFMEDVKQFKKATTKFSFSF